jgi:hypothetical protein
VSQESKVPKVLREMKVSMEFTVNLVIMVTMESRVTKVNVDQQEMMD